MSSSKHTRTVFGWAGASLVIVLPLIFAISGCSDDNNCPECPPNTGIDSADCTQCHQSQVAVWQAGPHADTQDDVAEELAGERVGETPDEVIHGADAENCIACHGPRAVQANGSMTESEALGYFFTTDGGVFTSQTVAVHTEQWAHVDCAVCHEVPEGHPDDVPLLSLFDSRSAQYTAMDQPSTLCGQCHGSLRFAETDHLTYDAWRASGHGDNQQDVADELAEERAGETPHEVVTGGDPENCVACHAPTAVRANGGMREDEALAYFFTTSGGTFTDGTSPQNTGEWPDVSCVACHDPHQPDVPSYFNSSTLQYEPMTDVDELCGQCHGSLRFAGTDHRSYDIRTGEGGMGVTPSQFMPSVGCADCHMYVADVEDSRSLMIHGHSWDVFVQEDAGPDIVSCGQSSCHPSFSPAAAEAIIDGYQTDFATLDATATANVEAATEALSGSIDPDLLAKLEQAQHNLEYAEMDESGGFHNHAYLMALLNDANDRALEILAAVN